MNRAAIWLTAAILLSLAACTDDPSPGATPPPTKDTSVGQSTSDKTTATAKSSTRPTEAPAVSEPVDLQSFYSRACDTLTTAQQSQLDLPPAIGNKTNQQFGSCEWEQRNSAGNKQQTYWVRLYIAGDPLGTAYRDSNNLDQYNEPVWPQFEPQQVRGLPALARSESPEEGYCEVIVGTGNGQGIEFGGAREPADLTMCDRLVTGAELVVDAVRK